MGTSNNKQTMPGTRDLILKTAQRLFMNKGYRAVSTREIARACKITQPALYYHFSDKESLYIAMIEKHVDRIRVRLTSLTGLPVADQLEEMFSVLSEDHPSSIMMMIHDISMELKPEHRLHLFKLWQASYLFPFQRVFEGLQQEGRLRKEITPEDAARFCLLTVAQKISSWESPSPSLSGRFRQLIDLILHGTVQG